ncbi:MAG: O-antigen ligase family protein [Ignavibacteria bacterium]|nr:O-antigen ligase family protein [Ignavibacteria bacterium]
MRSIWNSESPNIVKAQIVFIFIFTASLATSIFLNQVGYYGALFFFLVQWKQTGKNPFQKNGLEILLLWYLAAVLISAIFSTQHLEALHSFLKRAFLIPILYLIPAFITSKDRLNFFYKSVLYCTAIAALIYIGFAYKSYITNEMFRTLSGPEPFQHVITASQIFAFGFLMTLAFVIWGQRWQSRVINIFLSVVFFLALLGTYKRTGWLAAIVGGLIMLLLARKWILSLLIFVALIVFVAKDSNQNAIYIYSVRSNVASLSRKIVTEGKNGYPFVKDSTIYWSGYRKGLFGVNPSGKPFNALQTQDPLILVFKLNDSLYSSYALNTSSQILDFRQNAFIARGNKFYSPGDTRNCMPYRNRLCYYDVDSGLTIFDSFNPAKPIAQLPEYNNYLRSGMGDSLLLLYTPNDNAVVYKLDSSGLPVKQPMKLPINTRELLYAEVRQGVIAAVVGGNLDILYCDRDSVKLLASHPSKGIFWITEDKGKVVCLEPGTVLTYDIAMKSFNEISVSQPTLNRQYTACLSDSTLVVAWSPENKLFSIVDPYSSTNYSRLAFWRASIKIFKDYPIFGIGDIDVADYFVKYKRPTDKEVRGHFHNNFFHILATLGGFGFLAFVSLCFFLFYKTIKMFFAISKDATLAPYALGIVGVLVAFFVAGLSEWNFGRHAIISFIWMDIGLLFALYRLRTIISSNENSID